MERRHDVVLIVGDLNMRFGNTPGLHNTEDQVTGSSGRRYQLLRVCQTLSMVPLHGRPRAMSVPTQGTPWVKIGNRIGPDPSEPVAQCTSKSVQGTAVTDFSAEVDYILAPMSLPPSRFSVGRSPDTAVGTHRPVSAAIELQQVSPSVRAQRPSPRVATADYGDTKFWHAAGDAVYSKMSGFLTGVHARSMEANLEQLQDVYRTSMREAERGSGSAKASARNAMRRYRRYRGLRLPTAISQLFEEARRARNTLTRLKARNRKAAAKGGSIAEATIRSTQLERARADWESKTRTARKAAAVYVKRLLGQTLQQLEGMRVTNAHKLQTVLDRIAPTEPTQYVGSTTIPDEGGRFAKFFEELSRETREPQSIPGLHTRAPAWEHCFPHHDPATLEAHNARLLSPIEPLEIHQVMFPVHANMAEHPAQCNCPLCTPLVEHIGAWSQDRQRVPTPDLRCHLKGGKSPCLSGLTTEHGRCPRPGAWEGSLFDWRQQLCSGWAALFNQFMEHGRVPDSASFCNSVVTPIFKKGDRADPSNYRGIATGDLVPKTFALVLLRRLEHWCESLGVIPPNQAGFRANAGAEHHVFTLVEALKDRKGRGDTSYLLFLDLKKAYDSVPQSALWHVLHKLGLPEQFTSVLQDWATKRKVRVKVNLELSEEFSVTKGLPQGDPLSPLLFNLYISVLMRRIAQDPSFAGISIPVTAGKPQVLLKDLWYADDMVAIATSPAQLQALLNIVREWSDDWGIEVGVGEGKTNAMRVHAGLDSAEAALPPLSIGSQPVQWVTEYKYLGYLLRSDLGTTGAAAKLKRQMDAVVSRFFAYNKAVRSLSVATQLQIAQAQIVGCATYLMGVVRYSEDELRTLDAPLQKAARLILGAPKCVPRATIAADSRILPASAMSLMHRWRFMQSLSLSGAKESPAAQVMEAISELPTALGATATWTAITDKLLTAARELTTLGPPPNPHKPWMVHQRATCLARRVGYCFFRNRLAADAGPMADRTIDALLRMMQDSKSPLRAHAMLHCIGKYDRPCTDFAPSDNLRLKHLLVDDGITTPMSAWGAGCDGSPIALSTKLSTRQSRAIQTFRCGRAALVWWPFHFPTADPKADEASQKASKFAFISSDSVCRLCHAGVETPLHLIAACQHQEIVHYRKWMVKQTKQLLERMDFLLRRAFEPPAQHRPPTGALGQQTMPQPLNAALSQLKDAIRHCDWSSDDARTAIFRLITCAPWSAHDVRVPDVDATGSDAQGRQARADRRSRLQSGTGAAPVPNDDFVLCKAIGTVLDATSHQRSRLRQWANLWTRWSFKAVAQLATRHGCAQGIREAVAHCVVHGGAQGGRRRHRLCAQPVDDFHIDDLSSDDGDAPLDDAPLV